MPQEIRVLQCIECLMHQVDIVKKAKKWQCKVCGAKQSLRKECYRGSGAECRAMVQQLNMEEHEKMQKDNNETLKLLTNDDDFDWAAIEKIEHEVLKHQATITPTAASSTRGIKESKWSAYVEGDRNTDETQVDNGAEVKKLVVIKDVDGETRDDMTNQASFRGESKWAAFGQDYALKVENELKSLDALDTDFDWEVIEQFEPQALTRETEVTTSSQAESKLPVTVPRDKELPESNCRVLERIEQPAMKRESGTVSSSGSENKLSASVVNFEKSIHKDGNSDHQSNILNFGSKRKWSRSETTISSLNVKQKMTNEAWNINKPRKQSKWDQFM